ncbi:probable oligoribonuclease isoform X2 [Aplysia californica]|nr:probable oligoribonuclease isoform X2 [Aplysia californica]
MFKLINRHCSLRVSRALKQSSFLPHSSFGEHLPCFSPSLTYNTPASSLLASSRSSWSRCSHCCVSDTRYSYRFRHPQLRRDCRDRPFSNMSETNSFPAKQMSKDFKESQGSSRIIWIDLEMTGLDVDSDTILEIACIVTEGDLALVAEGPSLIIHQENEVLENMGEWCTEQHGKSGLTESVRNSKISLHQAEEQVLEFVKQHTPSGVCPIAGNSVGKDKQFLERYMPRLASHFHYRIVDVSTIKELCRRWYPNLEKRLPSKNLSHR